MKPNIFFRFFCISVLCLFWQITYAEEIHYKWSVSDNDISLTETVINDTVYSVISVEGLATTSLDNHIVVPYINISFALPQNVTNANLVITEVKSGADYTLTHPMLIDDEAIVNEDENQSKSFVGNSLAKVMISRIKGINSIASVVLCPIDYNEEENRLTAYSEIEFKIQYNSNEVPAVDNRIKNPNRYIQSGAFESDVQMLKDMVVNPEDIDTNAYEMIPEEQEMSITPFAITPLAAVSNNGSVKAYEYCIIAPQMFASALNRIVTIKRIKGLNVGVVYLENILSDSRFKNGTLKPSGNDDASILREFLYWSYQNGLRYALFVGKPPIMPCAMSSDYRNYNGYNGKRPINRLV